jgi:membrane protein required for colicin V production
MNLLDIIFLVPVIWLAWRGMRRGLIIELATLAALVLGIYAALYFSGYIAGWIATNLTFSEAAGKLISRVLTFLLVFIIVYIFGKILEKIIGIIALGFLNKLAGLIFGIIKAVILTSLVIAVINNYNEKVIPPEKKENSFLYKYITPIAPLIWSEMDDFTLNEIYQID